MTRKLAFSASAMMGFASLCVYAVVMAAPFKHAGPSAAPVQQGYELNDSHFHLTNYVQEGTNIRDFLKIMGNRVGRVALFGIPLQQMWDKNNTGEYAPTYYLQSDAPL